MSPPRRSRPIVESLDPRDVPGVLGALMTILPFALGGLEHGYSSSSHVTFIAVTGSASGTYTSPLSNPDAGKTTILRGNGTVGPLGKVEVSGAIQSPGFIAHGHAGGVLTLSNDKGTVTLTLTGPTQKGFAALPRTFQYRITAATGMYAPLALSESVNFKPSSIDGWAAVYRTGAVDLKLTPEQRAAPNPGRVTPLLIVAAQFSLRFHR